MGHLRAVEWAQLAHSNFLRTHGGLQDEEVLLYRSAVPRAPTWDGVMLDDRGFIAETNATNLFFIHKKVLCTPFGHACLPGITRAYILDLARNLNISVREGDFSLTQLYSADEAFTTGTMGGIAHIVEVDGRRIGPVDSEGPGDLTLQLQKAYPLHIPAVNPPFLSSSA